MSSNQPGGASGIPAHVVPLPPTPNLEFERKRAKKMLRETREGDRAALARVRIFREGINRSDVKLADVHLMIAREYGFSSWPKLVAYHETWERHAEPGPRVRYDRRDYYDARVQNIIRSHAGRTAFSSQLLATFVPRFYARSDAEIFASQITEAEAQLAVARMERFPNWDALIERASREMPPDERPADPKAHTRLYREKTYGLQFTEALEAIDRHDAAALSDLLDKNPEMISVEVEFGQDGVRKQLLIYSALHKE
jgi:hypothetical protein